MNILAVSDIESKYYYDYYTPGKLDDFGLILGCGDLSADYLEFLLTLSHCPLLYVRGNHDDALLDEPPLGCICIEDQIYVHQGVRILGLGGSHRYREGRNMYTEQQMRTRIRRLWLQILKYKGFDILLTHAPARNVNDLDSPVHRGFDCFTTLLDRYRPRYFVHGHVHRTYGVNIPQKSIYNQTTVINAYDYCRFQYEQALPVFPSGKPSAGQARMQLGTLPAAAGEQSRDEEPLG
jgi:predicted phosphodiesterase